MSQKKPSNQLTLFAGGSPVKICPLPESARAWLESDLGCGSSSIEFLQNLGHNGRSLKMSLAYYRLTEDEILPLSFEGWRKSGIYRPGECLTLNTTEWPNDGAVCSLLQVLETDVPQKYYLSAKACRGILRRAERRGRVLPEQLQRVLTQVVSMDERQDEEG